MDDGRAELLDFDRAELESFLSDRFELPPFRARQLVRWVHKRRATDFSIMTDISKGLRDELADSFSIYRPTCVDKQLSKDGTRKYLFQLADGSEVESVLIKQPDRLTLCVSSQVGCAMGCSFCRTALMGLKRNLHTHEIVGQVLAVQDDAAVDGDSFNNIVFMGMGEPLHNYNNVTRALRVLNDELGHDFSSRKITVSSSGLVPALEKFGQDGTPASLAISLNATTDAVRDTLIPINKKWPITTLMSTLRALPLSRSQRITIEYVMLRDVNDTEADLKRLPGIVHGLPCKINLIPYNENAGLGYQRPRRENIFRWQDYLLKAGLNTTIRWSKGEDIDAACGQLATKSRREKRVRSEAVVASP